MDFGGAREVHGAFVTRPGVAGVLAVLVGTPNPMKSLLAPSHPPFLPLSRLMYLGTLGT